jgi:hypothetical protein
MLNKNINVQATAKSDKAPPPVQVDHIVHREQENIESQLTQDMMVLIFDVEQAIQCNDIRKLKVAMRILRAAFGAACDEMGTRIGRSQSEMEIYYVAAGCQRIAQEKRVILTPQTWITNPLEK